MASTDPLYVKYVNRTAVITINRPEKLNAMTMDLYYELSNKLREIEQRDDITVTVITGTGRFFSAGADVGSIRPDPKTAPSNVDTRREITRGFVINNIDVTRAFYNHPKILIVALNGPTVGLSAALVAHADFIYAAPHTFVLTPFTSLGLVAEGGASRAFVERMGISKANEALLMSKRITCEELVQTGFVNKVFTAPSGKKEDSEGFLKLVLQEVEDKLGGHLNQSSILKIKELVRRPERELLDRQNAYEAFMGLERFQQGLPQEEFRKLASGEKKHKL